MQNNNQVEKIIEYLEAKIENIKKKLQRYESPIMQELINNSQSVQMEYSRLQARLDETEDNLLAIVKFSQLSNPQQPQDGAGEEK